jgi:hypothetical protein
MKGRSVFSGWRGSLVLVAAALCTATPPRADEDSGRKQGRMLADLAAEIVSCSVHPCLGDSVKQLREVLQDAIVTDGVFYYSDLKAAYLSVQGTLQGVVEWDLDDGIDGISLKVTDFGAEPEAFVMELEQVLPGCQIEWEIEDESEVEEDDVRTAEASCSTRDHESSEVDIAAYFAPGLIIFEMSP